jgi:hypothetical protein
MPWLPVIRIKMVQVTAQQIKKHLPAHPFAASYSLLRLAAVGPGNQELSFATLPAGPADIHFIVGFFGRCRQGQLNVIELKAVFRAIAIQVINGIFQYLFHGSHKRFGLVGVGVDKFSPARLPQKGSRTAF